VVSRALTLDLQKLEVQDESVRFRKKIVLARQGGGKVPTQVNMMEPQGQSKRLIYPIRPSFIPLSHFDEDGGILDVISMPGLEGAQQLQAGALGVHLMREA
jgi:hypothetical protein